MSETATEIIARIRAKEQERAYCLAVLDLWAQVQAQGIDIARVESFGLDTRILTEQEKRQRYAAQRRGQGDPYVETLPSGRIRLRVYNYVRHHDGGVTRLNPMLKAPPEHDDNQ